MGVIVDLAFFFVFHVLWPSGFSGRFDNISAAIALLAAIALFKFKRNVIHVIAGCAAAGYLAKAVLGKEPIRSVSLLRTATSTLDPQP